MHFYIKRVSSLLLCSFLFVASSARAETRESIDRTDPVETIHHQDGLIQSCTKKIFIILNYNIGSTAIHESAHAIVYRLLSGQWPLQMVVAYAGDEVGTYMPQLRHSGSEIAVNLAGPIAGLLYASLSDFYLSDLFSGEDLELLQAVSYNAKFLDAFNLLPISSIVNGESWETDGGTAFNVLCPRASENVKTLSLGGAVLVMGVLITRGRLPNFALVCTTGFNLAKSPSVWMSFGTVWALSHFGLLRIKTNFGRA